MVGEREKSAKTEKRGANKTNRHVAVYRCLLLHTCGSIQVSLNYIQEMRRNGRVFLPARLCGQWVVHVLVEPVPVPKGPCWTGSQDRLTQPGPLRCDTTLERRHAYSTELNSTELLKIRQGPTDTPSSAKPCMLCPGQISLRTNGCASQASSKHGKVSTQTYELVIGS